jgi:ribose 5-phosphate isomerase B
LANGKSVTPQASPTLNTESEVFEMRKLLIASDHAGFDLKEKLVHEMSGVEWVDLGPSDSARVDYPDFADRLCQRVISDKTPGVLICGSGQGMAIRANRHSGIRAALAWNEEVAKLSRGHNDANVLCLGARLIEPETAKQVIDAFLSTPFEGGRHADRVAKLERETC